MLVFCDSRRGPELLRRHQLNLKVNMCLQRSAFVSSPIMEALSALIVFGNVFLKRQLLVFIGFMPEQMAPPVRGHIIEEAAAHYSDAQAWKGWPAHSVRVGCVSACGMGRGEEKRGEVSGKNSDTCLKSIINLPGPSAD